MNKLPCLILRHHDFGNYVMMPGDFHTSFLKNKEAMDEKVNGIYVLIAEKRELSVFYR